MKRSSFLASLAALAVAPFVKLDAPKEPIPQPMPDFKQIGAKEVLDIYNDTGNMVYLNPLDLYNREFHDRLLKRVPRNSARRWIEAMAARGPRPKATHYQFFDNGAV